MCCFVWSVNRSRNFRKRKFFFFDFLGGLAFSFFRGEFCVGDLEGDTRLSDLVFFILCIFFVGRES